MGVFALLLTVFLGFMPQSVNTAGSSREVKLRVGRPVVLRNEGLTLEFKRVIEDSRCPIGTACIWAGNGKILLKVRKAGSSPSNLELNTTVDPKTVRFQRYEIELNGLDPVPRANTDIKKRGYIATITVSKLDPSGT
jgi:hypothetical protein